MNRLKIAAVTLGVAAVSTLVPLGISGAAHAATTKDGCTVSPLPPEFRGTVSPQGVPYIYYPHEVSCIASAGGLSVEVDTGMWEADRAGWIGDVDANGINNADEDPVGSAISTVSFVPAGGSTIVDVIGLQPYTDTDFDEELYAKVRFRVTSGLVTGGWSIPEFTPVTDVAW